MKTFLRLLLLFGLSVAAGAAASAQSTYNVQLNWTNNDASVAVCSSTVTKTCVKSRTLTDVTVSGTPVVLSSTIAPTATSFTTPSLTYTAQITRLYSLVTNYLDANGTAQTSSSATCGNSNSAPPCAVPIFIVLPPSNLTATPVQLSALVEPEVIRGM
jgi:hypothetical protein